MANGNITKMIYTILAIVVILGGGFGWLLKTSWVSAETETKVRILEPKVEMQAILSQKQQLQLDYMQNDIAEIKETVKDIPKITGKLDYIASKL